MGNIRVRVSQGGGTEDVPGMLGSGPVGLGLTSDDGTPIPSGIGLVLNINGQRIGSSTTPSVGTSAEGFSYPFSGSAWGLGYTVTTSNVPAGTTFTGLSGTVPSTSFIEDVAMSRTEGSAPAPTPAASRKSFFQRIWLFLLRLFGMKTA